MRRVAVAFLVLLAAVGLVAIVAGVSVVRGGFTARAKASGLEAALAETVRDLATSRADRRAQNPVAPTPEVLAKARGHYVRQCAGCHGLDGRGSDFGRRMFPPAADLVRSQEDMADGEIFRVVTDGIRFSGMPAFGEPGDLDEDREHWGVVHFVRRLSKLTPQDIEAMKKEGQEAEEDAAHH